MVRSGGRWLATEIETEVIPMDSTETVCQFESRIATQPHWKNTEGIHSASMPLFIGRV